VRGARLDRVPRMKVSVRSRSHTCRSPSSAQAADGSVMWQLQRISGGYVRLHWSAATPSSRTADGQQLGKAVAGSVRLAVVRPRRRQPSASGRLSANQPSAAVTHGHSPSLTRAIVGPGQPAGPGTDLPSWFVRIFAEPLGIRAAGSLHARVVARAGLSSVMDRRLDRDLPDAVPVRPSRSKSPATERRDT
jgi:hypothetical protein